MKRFEVENTVIMPALAMRGLVMMEKMSLHFDVGRKKSMLALQQAMAGDKQIFLTAQKDVLVDDPKEKDLYAVGVVAVIKQMLKGQEGVVHVMVEGLYRAKMVELLEESPALVAEVKEIPVSKRRTVAVEEMEAMMRVIKSLFESYSLLVPKMSKEIILEALGQDTAEGLFESVVYNIMLPFEDRQLLLEANSSYKRLKLLSEVLQRESQVLALERNIYEQVKEQMDKNQRDYFLREQLRVISNELGETDDAREDIETLMDQISAIEHISDDDREKLYKEADRLAKCPPQSQEANVIRTYLETCLELPWDNVTKDTLDLKRAQRILNQDHYGLDKVKERILEILAVRKLSPEMKGQIICLVGPPGVGKTSIGRSIARTMGREYVRLSLGGVRDESDIRGHRKTYVGAMPGRIINALKQVKVRNPLILLDEIDKMGADFKGDPSAAMLEVLDSEQNSTFRDHYI